MNISAGEQQQGAKMPDRPMQARRANLVRIACPHCGSAAVTRSSTTLTKTYREIQYQCSNVECGHTFVASLSIIRTICPSQQPDPTVFLPISPPRAARTPRITAVAFATSTNITAANDITEPPPLSQSG